MFDSSKTLTEIQIELYFNVSIITFYKLSLLYKNTGHMFVFISALQNEINTNNNYNIINIFCLTHLLNIHINIYINNNFFNRKNANIHLSYGSITLTNGYV